MKKLIIPVILVFVIVLTIFIVNKVTYSIYKSNVEVSVTSKGDKIVSDSLIEENGSSIYGYKLIKVTINNYTNNGVETITDVPMKCRVTIDGPEGTKFRELVEPNSSRTIKAQEGFTTENSITLPSETTYDSFTTNKESKTYNIEVMTDSDNVDAQIRDYNVTLNCYQTN